MALKRGVYYRRFMVQSGFACDVESRDRYLRYSEPFQGREQRYDLQLSWSERERERERERGRGREGGREGGREIEKGGF